MTGPPREAPRLLHVTTADVSLELLLGPQLRAFQAAGWDVHVASAPGPYVAQLAADGIVHHPLRHATRATAPHRDLAFAVELLRLFRALRADVVHTHNPKPGVLGRPAARLARVPLIVNTQHGLYAQPEDRRARRWAVYALERLAATCSDVELVQNPEDLATLARLRVPQHKLVLLGNGIDLSRFTPDPTARAAVRRELGIGPTEVVVGAVGRLVREKGYLELFDAARQVAATRPGVRWVVAGPDDGAKGDSLDASDLDRARAAGVELLGHRDDPERLYQAFDVYVLASHREGWPRAAMEAAACGVPIVATDIRGCRQVVRPAVTGVLVPPRDAGALAAAIATLVDDAELRGAMGASAAADAAERFGQDAVIRTTLTAYARGPARRRAVPSAD